MAVVEKKKATKRVPKELVYEMRHGSPIYYRDYDKVLSGKKKPEEVMGSSDLQAWMIDTIVRFLHLTLDYKKYKVLSNEVGYKFARRSWYNLDIAVVDRTKIKKLTGRFLEISPEVVIEIDTKADLRKFENPQDYFHRKTQDLLDSGVKKVIWIFTKEKKVWLAEKGKRWFITDWSDTVDLLDKTKLNIQKLLEEEGIKIEEER
ncbi:Uma2 family endonuclease [Persephonella sp.]